MWKKVKTILSNLGVAIKINLVPTAIITILWLILGWLRSAGIQWIILAPLNFLTGALAGVEGIKQNHPSVQ